jgi:hypothetical protein
MDCKGAAFQSPTKYLSRNLVSKLSFSCDGREPSSRRVCNEGKGEQGKALVQRKEA